MRTIISFMLILSTLNPCLAALDTPLGWYKDLALQYHFNIPVQASDALQKSDGQLISTSKNRPLKLGSSIQHALTINADSDWQIENDTAVWRGEFTNSAASLVFSFRNSFLPANSAVFFYEKSQKKLLYRLDAQNNKAKGGMISTFLTGETIIMEVNVGINEKDHLRLSLDSITQSRYDAKNALSAIASPGSCNVDVACPVADEWGREVRATALIVFESIEEGEAGIFGCTAVLVNNTNFDQKPYLVSAGHCYDDTTRLDTLTVYWEYQFPGCDQNNNLSDLPEITQTGASFAAAVLDDIQAMDFWLLELDEPPVSENVYYSGWNRSATPPSSAIGVHHPQTGQKSIAVDFDPISVVSNYFVVGAWDVGTTEEGSSGSGLWDPNHHLVALLSRGAAGCVEGTNEDNDQPDFYSPLSLNWNGLGSSATRLSDWLDPANSNAQTIDGMEACEKLPISITSSQNVVSAGEPITFTAAVSTNNNILQYAWDFDRDGETDATASSAEFVFDEPQETNVLLTVTDLQDCVTLSYAAVVVVEKTEETDNDAGDAPTEELAENEAVAGSLSAAFLMLLLALTVSAHRRE